MNKPIYYFTGFIDSGKTSAIKKTLLDPDFTDKEKTLIIAFEEGDEEYDDDFLNKTNSKVVYFDFDEYDVNDIEVIDKEYKPDRIFVEFNGVKDDKDFLANSPMPKGYEVAQIICTVDASLFKSHVKNMPQFMFNHISVSDVVVLNRSEDTDFKYLRNNLKTMNRNAYISVEDKYGNVTTIPTQDLFDYDNLNISDEDYGLFYMDVIDNLPKYIDKKIEFNGFYLSKEKADVFGRYAMVCCANDMQKLAINVVGLNSELKIGNYYHIKGTLKADRQGNGYRIYIKGESVKLIDPPKEELVSFN